MRGSGGVLRPDDSVEGVYAARGFEEDIPSLEHQGMGDSSSTRTVPWGRSLKQWTRPGGPDGSAASKRDEAKQQTVGTKPPDGMGPIADTPNGKLICEVGFFRPETEPHKVFRTYGEWWLSMQAVDRIKASGHEYSNRFWPFGDNVKTIEGRADYHDFYMLDRRKMQFSKAQKSFLKSEDGRFSTGPLQSSARSSFVMPAYAKPGGTT